MIKKIKFSLLLLFAVLLNSCSSTTNSNDAELTRTDVLGTWTVASQSYEKLAEEKNEDKIVSKIQLNSDSTVTVFFGKRMEKETKGKWRWKVEKTVGNDTISFSMESDVVITIGRHTLLAMQAIENKGRLKLIARNYIFEKKNKSSIR
ncbi:hypothetical protein D1614_16635 [Maribellus luteus]|uniref:Lipocalin-like domain-containing protein n=1 Tax=Maribellus luteus TaxID=2305463 RepID=A0A399SUM0_9BACT|nr:hypothetical protein [Maribellus luteus]RIJ47058.1 hypothetical protein D1614_16635 [Maribellus luteus]